MGAVYFNEFKNLSELQLLLFVISIIITLIGVAILAYDVGAVYGKIRKKVNKAFNMEEKARSIRTKSLTAFTKRSHGTREIYNVWGGTAHLASRYFSEKELFFENPTLRGIDLDINPTDNDEDENDNGDDIAGANNTKKNVE